MLPVKPTLLLRSMIVPLKLPVFSGTVTGAGGVDGVSSDVHAVMSEPNCAVVSVVIDTVIDADMSPAANVPESLTICGPLHEPACTVSGVPVLQVGSTS